MNLPPELEKQLVQRGTLPPGLQKRLQTCPEEFERRLPPPPPDCAQLVIGGHLVLLNRRTNVVVDLVHFETPLACDRVPVVPLLSDTTLILLDCGRWWPICFCLNWSPYKKPLSPTHGA
jgi:hypothetical protein